MRKWMRDRLQRRKKKVSPEKPSETPAPPLQPAYFDPQKPQESYGRVEDDLSSADGTVTPVPEPLAAPQSFEPDVQPNLPPPASEPGGVRRSRRRRGGRDRGGRGREQAVAQAFAPAVVKGAIPGAPPIEEEPVAEAEPQSAAPAATASTPAAASSAVSRPPKGLVVLAIGLPGSGKSTWFKRHNIVPLSSDIMRSLLFDDVREQRFQDLVFSNLRSMLKARLIAKRPMNYVDATNLTPQERQHWIKLAKDYGYEVHAVFFDVPLEVCIERHQRRDRVVPEDVMRRMAAKLKPPTFEEGFAKITVVRVKKKEAPSS